MGRGAALHAVASLEGSMWRPLVLYALAAVVLAGATIVELGRDDVSVPPVKTPVPAPTAVPAASPTPVAPLPAARPGLAVGVTQVQANLVSADRDPPPPR